MKQRFTFTTNQEGYSVAGLTKREPEKPFIKDWKEWALDT